MSVRHSSSTILMGLALAAGFGAGKAGAVEASGTTIAVIPSAAAAGTTGRRILKIQGSVFSGDVVETGAGGEAQIQFRDQTKLVVGPHSKLTIDSFVFDEKNTARKISMRATKGAFRFITGLSRKQAYSISTPASTIGIRGTRFDFSVRPNGETSFALYEGEARLCDRQGRCMNVRGSCAVVVAAPRGGIQPVSAGAERAARLRALFPYAVSQARLRPQFRVNTSGCDLKQASLPPGEALTVSPPTARTPPLGTPPEPGPGAGKPNNPGNGKEVGNSGEKFGGSGVRGNSGKGKKS